MRILVVNTGSSSLKLTVLDPISAREGRHGTEARIAEHTVERWEGEDHLEPLRGFVAEHSDVDAIGHRVVHGGPRFTGPVRIDDDVLAYLESISSLAPLHNPRAVAGIRAVRRLLPGVPEIAAFDTGFHATLPPEARTYALPKEWNERFGVRRYGFHGLSHAYAVRRAAQLVDRPLHELRIVSCHLGSGASLAAVVGGRSVDTTMGFTPLAGLVMQTRSGSIDPGLLLWLLANAEVDVERLTEVLEHESGLRGLSGTSGDMRDVLAARAGGDEDAKLAFDVFTHRLARQVGAMSVSAGGLDLLVFTGGIGEHVPAVRSDVAERLAHLGVAVAAHRNTATSDAEISPADADVRTVVVTAAEDVEVGRQVADLLAEPGPRWTELDRADPS